MGTVWAHTVKREAGCICTPAPRGRAGGWRGGHGWHKAQERPENGSEGESEVTDRKKGRKGPPGPGPGALSLQYWCRQRCLWKPRGAVFSCPWLFKEISQVFRDFKLKKKICRKEMLPRSVKILHMLPLLCYFKQYRLQIFLSPGAESFLQDWVMSGK